MPIFKKNSENSFVYNKMRKNCGIPTDGNSNSNEQSGAYNRFHRGKITSTNMITAVCLDNGLIMENYHFNEVNLQTQSSHTSHKLNFSRIDDNKSSKDLNSKNTDSNNNKQTTDEKIYKVGQKIESIKTTYGKYSNSKVTINTNNSKTSENFSVRINHNKNNNQNNNNNNDNDNDSVKLTCFQKMCGDKK